MSTRLMKVRWMRGVAAALVWAWALWLIGAASPLYAQSGITSPATGGAVSGDVPVFGTAVIDPFQKYELHFKQEPSSDDAYIYFYGNTVPVQNGQLGVWQAGGLPPGIYSLRLRVVKLDGNYAEYFAQNISVNQSPPTPTPTPTPNEPTPTPIPTATFTPAPQPTPVVGQVELPVTVPSPTPEAVAILLPTPTPSGAGPVIVDPVAPAGDGGTTRDLGEALSLNRLRNQFLDGMRFSAALFLGIAALYGGKRLFDWAWSQFS
jgi:hypothetical protein